MAGYTRMWQKAAAAAGFSTAVASAAAAAPVHAEASEPHAHKHKRHRHKSHAQAAGRHDRDAGEDRGRAAMIRPPSQGDRSLRNCLAAGSPRFSRRHRFRRRAPARAEAPAPLHVAFVGDSMADGLWGAMFRRLGKDKCLAEKVKLIRKAKNGTGLTRLDQFNWVDEIGKIVDEFHPDLFVGSFGINDRQGIVEKDKRAIAYPSAGFRYALYRHSSRTFLRAAVAQGASMVIIGLPIMLEDDANSDALGQEQDVRGGGEGGRRPTRPPTSSPGPPARTRRNYKPYLPNAEKQHGAGARLRRHPLHVRRLRHGARDRSIPRSWPV